MFVVKYPMTKREGSVVKAVMYAIVVSILGSAVPTMIGGLSYPADGSDWKILISGHCENVLGIVNGNLSLVKADLGALMRAVALFLFCSGCFGDEWVFGNVSAESKNGGKRFGFDLIGWMCFIAQSCVVSISALFSMFGLAAIAFVSLNLNSTRLRHTTVDDWLCENAIWSTVLLLPFILTGAEYGLSLALLVSAMLIFMIKFCEWRHFRFCSKEEVSYDNKGDDMTSKDLPNQTCFGCVENAILRHKGIITLIVVLSIIIGTGLLQYKLISNLGSEHDVQAPSVVCDGKFLKEGLTNWLTLFGVMCSFFGLIVPAGAYLLQLKTLREEKKEIFEKLVKMQNKDHEELEEKLKKERLRA